MAATAVFLVETSHHEGYCSGAECEYEQREETFEVESADQLETIERSLRRDTERSVDHHGSMYCKVSKDPRAQELGQHDCRVTLLRHSFATKSALKE